MRLLYLTAHYPPDFTSGATLQVRQLAERTAALGHDVTVLAGAIGAGLGDGETRVQSIDRVSVHWIGTAERIEQGDHANWHNPLATSYGARLLDSWQPDIVHAHALQTLGADLLVEARRRGIPTIVTMHDMWWWCPRLFLVDRAMEPCPVVVGDSPCECAAGVSARLERAKELSTSLVAVDQILVPSVALRDLVIANGVTPEDIVVDENHIDDRAAAPDRGRDGPADERRPVRFIYVGGDSPLKGRDVVLAAAALLRRTRRWRLTVHGVVTRRKPFRRGSRVRFAAPYEPAETARVFATADVVVIPSIARESYSLVAREALAAGLAVITSDCLGPTEVVVHGTNGLVVPTGDAAALAGAMRALIEDRHQLRRLQQAARDHPPHLRRLDEHAKSLLDRYRRLTTMTS